VLCLFAALPASASHRPAVASCTQKAASHSYHVTPVGVSCPYAKKYVKHLAAERLKANQYGAKLSGAPKGFKCSANSNAKRVQTSGTCASTSAGKSFSWILNQ
jgi:hypothetical protein